MLHRGSLLGGRLWYTDSLLGGRLARARSSQSEHEMQRTAALLASDPAAIEALAAALPVAAKKQIGLKWAMAAAEEEFAKADANVDGSLSFAEFRAWAIATVDAGAPTPSDAPPSRAQLRALWIRESIPYVGFGMVDNALMVMSGEAIDNSIGVALALSTMAAAAMGNAFSNGMGMVLHGTLERWSERLGLPEPRLTSLQKGAASVKNVKMAAGISGVVLGCLLGMFPLYFMGGAEANAEKALQKSKSRLDAAEASPPSK